MRLITVGIAALLVGRLLASGPPVFLLDDAYITMHNARLFWAADDPSFPGATPLASATSLIHTSAVALLHAGGLPITFALELTIWIAAWLYLTGVWRLCAVNSLSTPASVGVLALALLAFRTPYHLNTGLETPLAMAAVAWAIVAAQAERPPAWMWPLIGALPYVRPELVTVSAILLWVWRGAIGRRSLGLVVIGAAPWLTVSLVVTGSLVPSTLAAKLAFFSEQGLPWSERLARLGREVWAFTRLNPALIAGGLIGWALSRGRGRRVIAVVIAVLLVTTAHSPSQWGFNWYRYLHPFVPFVLGGLVLLMHQQRRLGTIALVASLGWAVVGVGDHLRILPEGWYYNRALVRVAEWVESADLAGTVLVHDVGVISEVTQGSYIDLVGLKTPHSRAVHERLTAPSGGRLRSQAIATIACDADARAVVVFHGWEGAFHISSGLRAAGWTVSRSFRTGQTALDYSVFALQPPRSCEPLPGTRPAGRGPHVHRSLSDLRSVPRPARTSHDSRGLLDHVARAALCPADPASLQHGPASARSTTVAPLTL